MFCGMIAFLNTFSSWRLSSKILHFQFTGILVLLLSTTFRLLRFFSRRRLVNSCIVSRILDGCGRHAWRLTFELRHGSLWVILHTRADIVNILVRVIIRVRFHNGLSDFAMLNYLLAFLLYMTFLCDLILDVPLFFNQIFLCHDLFVKDGSLLLHAWL